MTNANIPTRAWIELGLLSLLWGAIFLVVEFVLQELTPFWAVFHRVFWAALALWAVLLWKGERAPADASRWIAFFVMGALNNAIPFSLITWGQVQIESGLASILNAATAFFAIIVAAIFLADERLTSARIIGVLIGVAGVAVIIGPKALIGFDPRSLGQIAVLGAAVSYAFAGVWARKRLVGLSPMVSATGMLTGSAAIMAVIAFLFEGPPDLALSATSIAAIFYMAIFGTVFAYILFYRILDAAGSGNLMLCTIMMPPISILLGWAVLGEALSANAFFGCGLILIGLIILDGRVWRTLAGRSREA
ncbi:MAG: DMT family transporter [Pseudomonadota bacterium]